MIKNTNEKLQIVRLVNKKFAVIQCWETAKGYCHPKFGNILKRYKTYEEALAYKDDNTLEDEND